MHTSNYGKYEVPQQLIQLIELEDELNEKGLLPYGDLMGLYFSLEPVQHRYLNTPVDVIPFAHSGADGIHFGFLTDFGEAPNLDEVYIVRVTPMDFDEPVKIMARNLSGFISLIYHYRYVKENLDVTSDQEKIERFLRFNNEDGSNEQVILEAFFARLNPQPMESLASYFATVKEMRQLEVMVETWDGIGVIKSGTEEIKTQKPFHLERDMAPDLEQVRSYFAESSLEYKLAFVRDAQSAGILYNEPLLKAYVVDELHKLNLHDEALRLSSYWE